jgi:hypothetical protein
MLRIFGRTTFEIQFIASLRRGLTALLLFYVHYGANSACLL